MKILICPLNWGLGHATRCIPIIKQALERGDEPVIVADGFPLELLRQEFPTLSFIEYPSYRVFYTSGTSMVWSMWKSMPYILSGAIREHRWLKKIIRTENIEMVISDNRFGLWNKNIRCVYITHQLMVKMPRGLKFMEAFVWRINRSFIQKYDACLVPDYPGKPNLSGDLSHKYPLPVNTRFIGPLSRFEGFEEVVPNFQYDVVAVVSGPEPQRTLFEKQIIEHFKNTEKNVLIVRGEPNRENSVQHINRITLMSHIDTPQLAAILLGARQIICRSGYSTIMDLAVLDCLHKAVLIATPGQTEQEYLAMLHKQMARQGEYLLKNLLHQCLLG